MDKFTSIFQFGQHTFVLENNRVPGTEVFLSKVLNQDIKPDVQLLPPLSIEGTVTGRFSGRRKNVSAGPKIGRPSEHPRIYRTFPTPGKNKNLNRAVNTVINDKVSSKIADLCGEYVLVVENDVGKTCHSSALEFLKSWGHRASKGTLYTLIAWAIIHTPLSASGTYPMIYEGPK